MYFSLSALVSIVLLVINLDSISPFSLSSNIKIVKLDVSCSDKELLGVASFLTQVFPSISDEDDDPLLVKSIMTSLRYRLKYDCLLISAVYEESGFNRDSNNSEDNNNDDSLHRIVGTAEIALASTFSMISNLGVAENMRRKGVGRRLLQGNTYTVYSIHCTDTVPCRPCLFCLKICTVECMLHAMSEWNSYDIRVNVEDDNPEAKDFYLCTGFEEMPGSNDASCLVIMLYYIFCSGSHSFGSEMLKLSSLSRPLETNS